MSPFFKHRPIYQQLREILAQRIASGEWKPGIALPNEGDLAREYGVSPGTMRKALDLLEKNRLISRRQGRGSFVNNQSSDELADRFINIRGSNGQRIVGDASTAEITAGVATDKECKRLRLRPEESVYRIRQVRLVDGRPFMFEEATVPSRLFPGLADIGDLAQRIVPLAQRYGILLGKAEERISVATTSPSVAGALNVGVGSPIIVLDRLVRSIDGRPVEWRLAWCDLSNNHYLAMMG